LEVVLVVQPLLQWLLAARKMELVRTLSQMEHVPQMELELHTSLFGQLCTLDQSRMLVDLRKQLELVLMYTVVLLLPMKELNTKLKFLELYTQQSDKKVRQSTWL
jgi:hypothetical protein